jgi:hypothetical protein
MIELQFGKYVLRLNNKVIGIYSTKQKAQEELDKIINSGKVSDGKHRPIERIHS